MRGPFPPAENSEAEREPHPSQVFLLGNLFCLIINNSSHSPRAYYYEAVCLHFTHIIQSDPERYTRQELHPYFTVEKILTQL